MRRLSIIMAPAFSAMPGQFLLKDIVLFGASVWSLGESLKAIVR